MNIFLKSVITDFIGEHFTIIADAPGYVHSNWQVYTHNRKIIALDGVADYLKDFPVQVDILLGDFDSLKDPCFWNITSQEAPYQTRDKVWVIPAKDSKWTDLQKALLFCDQHRAASIFIVNATGGRMDHTLVNIHALRQFNSPDRLLLMYTQTDRLQYVKNQTITLRGKLKSRCAVIAFPQGMCSSFGLEYEMLNYPLEMGISESVSNALKRTEATIKVVGEALIITEHSVFVQDMANNKV